MKLHFEPLERRDLLTAMRIASWNTANNPDDPVGDADYAMILGAIGDESVQGNSLPIDLLALQETDVPGSGGDSIGRIETILEGLYPSVDFDFSVSTLDGGGDSTGFVYNTNTLSLLDAQQLDAGLTHTTIRGLFRPVGTTGDADFYMYSTHLKAGPTAGDQSIRAAEAFVPTSIVWGSAPKSSWPVTSTSSPVANRLTLAFSQTAPANCTTRSARPATGTTIMHFAAFTRRTQPIRLWVAAGWTTALIFS